MEVLSTDINGLLIIQPKVFEDTRGYFFESYNKTLFHNHGITAEFAQDNQSLSQKGIVRGLHFQNPPFAQGKLVRIIKGSVLDVAVDIRSGSPTYGSHFKTILNESNKTMMWIPEGFAHGFLTLEDNTIFSYKCTKVYNKESEHCILWNDTELGIDWGITDPVLSDRDKKGHFFKDLISAFTFH